MINFENNITSATQTHRKFIHPHHFKYTRIYVLYNFTCSIVWLSGSAAGKELGLANNNFHLYIFKGYVRCAEGILLVTAYIYINKYKLNFLFLNRIVYDKFNNFTYISKTNLCARAQQHQIHKVFDF